MILILMMLMIEVMHQTSPPTIHSAADSRYNTIHAALRACELVGQGNE